MHYIGHNKSGVVLDAYAIKQIKPELLELEPALAQTCWWDYRGMNAARRTMMFAGVQAVAYARFYGKYDDYERATYKSGFRGKNIMDLPPGELQTYWKARQMADGIGLKYETFCHALFERAKMAGWKHLPRPSQMYGEWAMETALRAQAKEFEGYLPDFANPGLLAGSTAPYKADFDTWLMDFASRRPNRQGALQTLLDRGLLTQAQIASIR